MNYYKANDKTIKRNWADITKTAKAEAKSVGSSFEAALHRVTGCDIEDGAMTLRSGEKIKI